MPPSSKMSKLLVILFTDSYNCNKVCNSIKKNLIVKLSTIKIFRKPSSIYICLMVILINFVLNPFQDEGRQKGSLTVFPL